MAEVRLTNIENIPTELRALNQWVLWRWEQKPNGDRTKVPITPAGLLASSTNPSTWRSFAGVSEEYLSNGNGDGIGFVFTKDDPYIGIDLDDCFDYPTGLREPENTWLNVLDSYYEISPSGKGVKVIIRGKLPEGTRHGFGRGNGIYESGRFFTITGDQSHGPLLPIRDVPPHELQVLLDTWFPQETKKVEWEPQPERLTDNEVWRMVSRASNGTKAVDLLNGRWVGHYPSKSEADAGLLAILAFYTGPNPAQLDRLYRHSALYGEKWDEMRGSETYGERTIRYVLDNATEFYGGPHAGNAATPAADGAGVPPRPVVVTEKPQPRWRRMMEGYPAVEAAEMPWALRKLHEHIAPLAAGFVEDWSELSILGFISSLFPNVRFQNLPLGVWTLGISEQATGKSLVADELNEIVHGVAEHIGTRLGGQLAKYGSGSTAGMIRRLQGNKRAMLAYFSEWSSLMKEMERDFGSTMKDTLLNLYDGRSQQHVLALETIEVNNPRLVVAGVTTYENWVHTGTMSGINDGFYSRLLFIAPDTWTNYVPLYSQQAGYEREKLVRQLGEHWCTLPEFSDCAFVNGEEALDGYRRTLGMISDGPRQIRNLDDAPLRHTENATPGGRSIVKVKKLAALLALCEREPDIRRDTLWVGDDHIALAIRLVQRSNAYAARVFGYLSRSKDESQASAVRLALQRNGALKIGAIIHEAAMNRVDADRALELLIDDGEVETTIINGVRHWKMREE